MYKLADPSFISILNKNNLILLCETWTDQKQNIDINGFMCYAVHRSMYKPSPKRNSGGVASYVRSEIDTDVQFMKTDKDDRYIMAKIIQRFLPYNHRCIPMFDVHYPVSTRGNALMEKDVLDRIARGIVNFRNPLGDLV